MSMINIALSGANAAQLALQATSQNMANSATPGYTRQRALLAAVGPGAGAVSAGNGVQVTSLLRFSDSYKTQQLWRTASQQGQYAPQQPYLTQLEQVMGSPTSGLTSGIDKFFKALNAVGVDPTSTPLRQQVINSANAMAQNFNSINTVLSNQVQSVQQQASAMIPGINATLQSIATLNQQIAAAAAGSSNTSALVDQRDQAIDKLAGMVGVETADQPDGSRSISLVGGQPLVIGSVAATLSATVVGTTPTLTLAFANATFSAPSAALGGQLGGLALYQQNTLQPMVQSVADIARALATRVNDQLALGYDQAGNPGAPMFVFNPASASAMLQIAPGFQTGNLALSGDGTPGDSSNLQKLIAIKSQPINVTAVGSVLLADADTQLVGMLAIQSQQNQTQLATTNTVRSQAVDDWLSTSGVNQDEEGADLMQFQNMYQANLKVIAVANALFDATMAMFH